MNIKNIELTDELPEEVVLNIAKYLFASHLGTYPEHVYARLTDTEGGYYIACGMHLERYLEDKEKFDAMSDITFKIHCDSNSKPEYHLAIILAGDCPKFDRRIICGRDYITFEQMYNIIQYLEPYIIKNEPY